MNATPALVTRSGAARLPRAALWLFCAAYVMPGMFGRDPWRNADLTAFGLMSAMAYGRTPWLNPTLGGVVGDNALLPHWLGAAFIHLLGPMLGAPLAARLPFALLLTLALALVWYATFHLARTDAAQPVPFAFGGEADPVDYARAIADAALLALIATLGLLQLGHETTPEMAQLCAVAALLWGLAAAPFRAWAARATVLMALLALSASGAPAVAVAMGIAGLVVCTRSSYPTVRGTARWVGAGALGAALIGGITQTWRWRVSGDLGIDDLGTIVRQWVWFLWPAWPAVLWTLWRWRRHMNHRHVAVPLVVALTALVASVLMGGSDRALLLALPGMAVLAAFALPTLRRSASAAVDWLSMAFFTACAITIWVIYVAMMTGVPAQPAANVAKLAPGFVARFSLGDLLPAVLATLAWLWLVRWRTGRHREAVWKSMVLPSSGVALCWLLLMTLWLPLLDYARSLRPWVDRLSPYVGQADCIAAPRLSSAQVAALEVHGGWQVDASESDLRQCPVRVVVSKQAPVTPPPAGWTLLANVQRPTDREEITSVWQRTSR